MKCVRQILKLETTIQEVKQNKYGSAWLEWNFCNTKKKLQLFYFKCLTYTIYTT